MRLLLITDHRFLGTRDGVFDDFCFDRAFFADYRKVCDEVEVVARLKPVPEPPVGALRSDGDGIVFTGMPDTHGLRWLLAVGAASNRLLRRAVGQASALVLRVPSQLGWRAARLAAKLGTPYMIEVIGDPRAAVLAAGNKLHRRLLANLLASQHRHVALHAHCASYVTRINLPTLYPVRQGCLKDYISSVRLPGEAVRAMRRYAVSPRPLRIVMVGSFTAYKRQADLIRAVAILKARGVPARAHFAGGGSLLSQAEELRNRLGLQQEVVFLGHVSQKEVLEGLLDGSDICFFSSTDGEGLPRAILEAMARGLPVCATRAAGNPELVRDSELVRVGDVESMARLLAELASDPDRLTAMSEHSIETARRYTADQLSPRRIRLYRHLCAAACERETQAQIRE